MKSDSQLKVEIHQEFNVPVKQLYEAWTNPDQLKVWWKPMSNVLKEVTNELWKGGRIDYKFEADTLHISGNYIEIKEYELLEYTWNWELPDDSVKNSSYKLLIKFIDAGDKSTITVQQDTFVDEEGMLPHKEGWRKGLSDLKDYLTHRGKI
jgi:uncharacterized protein YndB with AHSA1/START domain